MLESMIILTVVVALIFTVLQFTFRFDNFMSPFSGLVAFVAWFSAAAACVITHFPYSHLFENAADNSYEVVTGVQELTYATPLRWLFIGLGFICLGYAIFGVIAQLIQVGKGVTGGEEGEE